STVIFICGCVYKFIENSWKNIFVYPITNFSLQPLVDIYLTDALKNVFIEYPEYHLVNDVKDAEYTLKVHIKKWERPPLFFSGEKSREIVIAEFQAETEITLYKNGEVVFADTITENIPVSIAKSYEEEDILSEASKKLSLKIYFYIVEKNERKG
ncbi:MAG: hypothetical protein PHI44_05870, partial [Candidatus Ratteibacteria bacterium]|nr:hypothetical protein [Candidatus Ratteibacteria bacterium]